MRHRAKGKITDHDVGLVLGRHLARLRFERARFSKRFTSWMNGTLREERAGRGDGFAHKGLPNWVMMTCSVSSTSDERHRPRAAGGAGAGATRTGGGGR